MPTYTYQCGACDETYDRVTRIASRDEPEQEPCEKCHAQGQVKRIITPVQMSYTLGGIMSKTPDGFKDVLRVIKSQSGKDCTIDV